MMFDYFEFSRRNKYFIETYRRPVIEAPFAFLDEEMKVLSRDAIESAQMMLRLVPELLKTIDMVSGFDQFLRVINAVMSEIRNIQCLIA